MAERQRSGTRGSGGTLALLQAIRDRGAMDVILAVEGP
jgi:hypothetical protein